MLPTHQEPEDRIEPTEVDEDDVMEDEDSNKSQRDAYENLQEEVLVFFSPSHRYS